MDTSGRRKLPPGCIDTSPLGGGPVPLVRLDEATAVTHTGNRNTQPTYGLSSRHALQSGFGAWQIKESGLADIYTNTLLLLHYRAAGHGSRTLK